MNKITIVIESSEVSIKPLEELAKEAMAWFADEARDRFQVDIERVFVVPSVE